jgi:glycosyltransferase involved in cell wall biosynthesis
VHSAVPPAPAGALVSVCIVNHNYGRFVDDAIASALSQTHHPVQVVVVDDGSTDDSIARLRRWGRRIEFVTQPNHGMGAALNLAFSRARGEYVIFLDADDCLHPDALARAVAEFTSHPGLSKVQFRMELVDEGLRHLGLVPVREGLLPEGDLSAHVLRFRSYPWLGPAAVFSASALRRILPLDPDAYRVQKDYYLHQLTPLLGPIRSLDAPLYRYRRHGSNAHLGRALDLDWLHDSIRRTVGLHDRLVALADELGMDGPPRDVRAPPDAAFIAFRLASLVIDPSTHPIAGDSRPALLRDGLRAVRLHPYLGRVRGRLLRAAWFVAVATAPRRVAARMVKRRLPDGPNSGRSRPRHRPHRWVRL